MDIVTRGEYSTDNVTYGVVMSHSKMRMEMVLVLAGSIVSAYKYDSSGQYAFNNNKAYDLAMMLNQGLRGCTSRNCSAVPFALGAASRHEFTKSKMDYRMDCYQGSIVGARIQNDKKRIQLEYCSNIKFSDWVKGIEYIKLVSKDTSESQYSDEDGTGNVRIRSVQEIMLSKEDVTWLKNKKYFIVNDDEVADKIFSYIDNYDGAVAYDTETTGLRINCFGKINSPYQKTLVEYNNTHKVKIRADRLVGIIFCIEKDVSYYFPCWNRKFKNLYDDRSSAVRNKIINNTKATYILGEKRNQVSDFATYWRNTKPEDVTSDCVLMERVRNILETKHIVAHNGSFEWKVGWQYEVDTNLRDDTMIMHQMMYKFRSTTSNKGEPSNLKYLSKVELGIDQWELGDFFPDYKEDEGGKVIQGGGKRKTKKNKENSTIDFSYMDYEGTRIYAPTDGDATFLLYLKYKKDMKEHHSDIEYIYQVEVLVACAVAYMEFYGHRIDEDKILNVRDKTKADIALIESEIRQKIGYAAADEVDAYNDIKSLISRIDAIENDKQMAEDDKKKEVAEKYKLLLEDVEELYKRIASNSEHVLNLASPAQVSDLFYNKLGYPIQGDKMSVNKRAIKALCDEKNDDGTSKYPVASMYSQYKNLDTLMTKFFDNLPYFMYPGGFVFSHFGQIATATGRMSCIEENEYVTTKYGYRRIKDIKVGDIVYCYDTYGNIQLRKVMSVIDNGYRDCIKVRFIKYGAPFEVVCTPDHKIRKADGEWVQACELVRGDEVSGMGELGKSSVVIFDSYEEAGRRKVYDLEVKDFHNFIAGGICVHNCSKPNCQQYPKAITKIVIPRDGYVMIDADYSQIEYRVLTAMAKNEGLMKLFADPDSDYHTLMASLMFEVPYESVTSTMRKAAKSFNFGIPYGMGIKSLAILLHGTANDKTIRDAKEKRVMYFKNQPKTEEFFNKTKEQALVNGYTKTYWSRVRSYSFVGADGSVNEAKKASALRQAGNAIIQGCESGDTRIQTKELGIVKVEDVVGRSLNIWNGLDWTMGDVVYSGKKRKCIVKFSTGQEFVCSPIHKFLVKSTRGNERFVECQDLRGSKTSTNPHRIVINRKYEPSDYEYSSQMARLKYTSLGHPAKNVFLDDIEDSFKIGVMLGRLASDGNILCGDKYNLIRHIVAEHEFSILPTLIDCMKNLGVTMDDRGLREGRNEEIKVVKVHSKSLTQEVSDLDIKHQLHDNIFMDTELLRGFLRGMFDGDGGISGKVISLTFGNQCDFEPMCRDIQKALLFFGIRSRYRKYPYRYKIDIVTYDNQRFLDLIGFINEDKQEAGRKLECKRDGHIFNRELVVESVEITDEYIDMYDVCNTDDGYYVADGIITHNTAADIFKISVARNFAFIRKNKLFGDLLISNMIHDEQLMECNVTKLNARRVIAEIGNNMQFTVPGFPPLFIGAGIGPAWGYAKDKMAEIHPMLMGSFMREAGNVPLRTGIEDDSLVDMQERKRVAKETLDYFANSVLEFRRQKIIDYICDPSNRGRKMHPAIGGLLNLQFNYGRGENFKDYTGPNGEKYDDAEFLALNLDDFIKENHLNATSDWFKASEVTSDIADENKKNADKEYMEGDEMEDEDDVLAFSSAEERKAMEYMLIEEDNKVYGSDINDLIHTFGTVVLKNKHVCGINTVNMYYMTKEKIIDYLVKHQCDEDDEARLEVLFLNESRILIRTGVYVKDVDPDVLSDIFNEAKGMKGKTA